MPLPSGTNPNNISALQDMLLPNQAFYDAENGRFIMRPDDAAAFNALGGVTAQYSKTLPSPSTLPTVENASYTKTTPPTAVDTFAITEIPKAVNGVARLTYLDSDGTAPTAAFTLPAGFLPLVTTGPFPPAAMTNDEVYFDAATNTFYMNDLTATKFNAANIEVKYSVSRTAPGGITPSGNVVSVVRESAAAILTGTAADLFYGKVYDMENQNYQYEFATRTYVTINSLAKNVYTDKMYADLKAVCDFALSLTTSDPKVLEKYYSDPPHNLSGLDLKNAVDEHLAAENAKMNAAIYDRFNNMLYIVDRHAENAIREHTQLGARGRRLELLQSRLEQDEDSYMQLLSDNEDTDMIKAILLKAAAEAAYAASLRASANIVQLSLANFIG